MKIERVWLNGYGRFFKRTLELAPGLQVVLGPNEQGKTTLRSFIGDMLYGQKRSTSQRIYDDANELRRPWATPTCYGGQIVYRLDEGREIEVQRNFDRKQELVQVFDRTQGREITNDFEFLRNRESNFAQAHLGLSKTVFLSTASIGHMSLENLGDADALVQIREKILSLADSGEEENSSESAMKRLEARLVSIGRNSARSKPLPAARARVEELEEERAKALELRRELGGMEEQRREALERVASHRERRAALEEELRLNERIDRARRLHEADKLAAEIDEATKKCFALGSVREFPLEQQHEVQRAANMVATAQGQLQRTEAERRDLQRQLEEERNKLGGASVTSTVEVPEDIEKRLAELEPVIDRLRERLEEVDAAVAQAERRLQEAQADLDRLPDFSRLPEEPVLWLNQLANSFRLAQHSRETERQSLRKIQAHVSRRRRELDESERIFVDRPDFPEQAREYTVLQRVHGEQQSQILSRLEAFQGDADAYRREVPAYIVIAVGFVMATLIGASISFVMGNPYLLVPSVLCLAGSGWYFLQYAVSRRNLALTLIEVEAANNELEELETEFAERSAPMEELIAESEVGSLRELEALYDKYREDRTDLVGLVQVMEAQQAKVQEEEERVHLLYSHVTQAFLKVGETITDERQIPEAASRAIARYQEYRDAKRRSAEARDQLSHHRNEQKRVREGFEECLREERELSLDARRLMRENDYPDEAKHDSALTALRAFRLRTAQLRQKRGRIEVLQEKATALDRRLEAEKRDSARHEENLARYLRRAGVNTVEEWHERAEQAKSYRELWKHRSSLKLQLDTLLHGDDIEFLRRSTEGTEPLPAATARTAEELKGEIEELAKVIDEAQKEAHALHIALTERAGGMRSLNEIEEERAEALTRVEELEFELEAAAYAATMLEEVAHDKHTRIAPRLAQLASKYLSEITGGAYNELLISRDLQISVRIPQTSSLNGEPEKRLSKGTVDQIYLAIRLAMIQSLNETGESIPMLLDDPFANYDDARLERAMRLLLEVAKKSQVLLFTCREDVARVAQAVGAPVLRL